MTASSNRFLVALVIALVVMTTSAMMGTPRWWLGGCVGFSLFLFFVFLNAWMKDIHRLVRQSDALSLRKVERKVWSFKNLIDLFANQQIIAERLALSATAITELINGKQNNHVALHPEDPLAKALAGVQESLMKIKTDEANRRWIAEGLASCHDILRRRGEGLTAFSNLIIVHLAKYLQASQAGLFIDREENGDHILELTACYAYERQQVLEGKVSPGEGLLGQCMVERKLILVTDIPKNYVRITSGLGGATPRNIVIAPLIYNDIFCGAIEMASFSTLQPHQIEFLTIISSDIAAEIVALKTVETTQRLLSESTQMAKALQSRQAELRSYLKGVDNTIASAEFQLDGQFSAGNELFLKVLGYPATELLGKSIDTLLTAEASTRMMWENLRLGKSFSGEFKMKNREGHELWLMGTFNPIMIEGDIPEKIVMLAQFTSQEKERINDLSAMVHALKITLPLLEVNPDFSCKSANEKALKLFNVSRLSIKNKSILDFIAPCYHEKWEGEKSRIFNQEFTTLEVPFLIAGVSSCYEVNIFPVRNLKGSVAKVIILLVKEVAIPISILASA